MPGIFDMIYARGLLDSLFGGNQPPQASASPDPYDDTQRMLNRQRALEQGGGSVTNPAATLPAGSTPARTDIPMILQAMQNGGVPTGYTPAEIQPTPPISLMPQSATAGQTGITPGAGADNQIAAQPAGSGPDPLSGFGKFAKALELAGRGFTIAGSKDPGATYAAFAEMDKPKITPLAGGAFSMVTKPDGTQQIVKNEDVAKYLADQNDLKKAFELLKIDRRGEVQKGVDLNKSDIKTDAEARPLLNDTETLIGRWKQAADMIKGQGTWSQVQGAFPTIAGFFGTDDAAKNKFLQGLTVDETLLNTAKTKGAISDREMALFKTPIPALTDDREKVWKPYIESRLPVLEKLKNFYESQVARGEKPVASTPAAPKASSGGSDYEAQAKSAWGSYDPDQYEYRMNNGVLQRRKK